MSTTSPTQNLELAHVLFMDIVSYSTLPMDKQEDFLFRLQEAIKKTTDFQRAQARGELIRLPTGDGMALVFFGDPEAPVRCAVQLCGFLRESPDIKLRMGIHTGPVYRITDINANLNVAGGGINMAQRVMDCGDASHILLSSTVAEVLQQLSRWKDALHDFGHVQVKHGVNIHVYNLFCEDAGNAEVPAKVRNLLPTSQQDTFVMALRRIWMALVAPSKAFTGIEYAPNWWTPWLVMSVLGVMLAVTVEYRVGYGPLLDSQLRRSAIAEKKLSQLPPEERTARIESAVTAERYASYGFPVLLLVGAMFVAAMVKIVLKIVEKRDIAFITALAIVMYSLAPQVIRTTLGVVILLVSGNAGGFTVHDPLPTNFAYFIDLASNPLLMAAAQLADVFRLWTLVLCVVGFSLVTKAKPVTIALVTGLSYAVVLLAVAATRSAFL